MSVLRPRSYKAAAERREQILDCALGCFGERGYHATSIADVCARARIGRGTLYQYFDDKRSLLVALAERITSRVTRAIDERPLLRLPSGFRPSTEQLVQFVEDRFTSVLSIVFEDAATARLILRVGRGADGVVDQMLHRVDEALLGRMEAELRTAQQAGAIRPLDARFVARFFLGGIEKIVLTYLDEDRLIDIPKIAREAALLEVLGVAPAVSPPTQPTEEIPS